MFFRQNSADILFKGLVKYVAGPLIFAYFYVIRLNSHQCGGRNHTPLLIVLRKALSLVCDREKHRWLYREERGA